VKIDEDTIIVNDNGQISVDSSIEVEDAIHASEADSATTALTSGTSEIANSILNLADESSVKVWVGSQADYDLVSPKESDVLYFIKEE
jgi:hypothetical protein